MTLGGAAEMLSLTKSAIKTAVANGTMRSVTMPFKSNLRPDSSAVMTYVNSEDVRSVLNGTLDLALAADVRQVTKKSGPTDMTEFSERFTDLERSVEQVAAMAAAILENMDKLSNPTPKKPKAQLHGI